MRCDACDKWLDDFESTIKSATTGEYINLCRKHLKGLGIATVDRIDLDDGTLRRNPEDRTDEALDPFKPLVDDPLFDDEEFHDEDDSFGF